MQGITVSNQIIEVLNYLGEKFGIAIDWSNQNVMPYIKELLGKFISWEIATSWMWIVLGAIFLLLGIFLIVFELCNQWNTDGVLFVIGVIIGIISFLIIFTQVYDIITATYFPEKILFEEIKLLINN